MDVKNTLSVGTHIRTWVEKDLKSHFWVEKRVPRRLFLTTGGWLTLATSLKLFFCTVAQSGLVHCHIPTQSKHISLYYASNDNSAVLLRAFSWLWHTSPSLHCKNYAKTTSLWSCLPFHIYMTLVLEILFRFTVTKHYNPRHILNSECFIFRSQDRKHFQARFNFGQRSKEKLIASVIHAGYKSSAMLLLNQRQLY